MAISQQDILLKISQATSRIKNLEQLLKASVKISADAMGVDRASIWLTDGKRKYAVINAVFVKGRLKPIHQGTKVELSKFPKFKRIISEGKIIHSPDILKVVKNKYEKKLFAEAKIKSSLSVPLKIKNKVLGAFNFGTLKNRKVFTTSEIKLCQIIANQVAVGIENVRLYQELEDRASNLQEKSMRSLRESEKKYRTLLENLPQMIFLKDKNSVYISANENFCRSLGIKPEEFKGKTDFDYFPKKLAQKYRKDDREIIRTGKTKEIIEDYIEKGKRVIVQTVKTPVLADNGKPIGVLGIFWDITQHRQMEEALIQKEQIARERAKLLTDLRDLERIDDILTRVCEAVRDSGLFKRAVMTLHKPRGQLLNFGQVGLSKATVKGALEAPPMDRKLKTLITSKRFRISDSFFVPVEAGVNFSKSARHIPESRKPTAEGDWQPGDELFVPLRDFSGKIMGYLSVDTPIDGCRPDTKTIEALEMLVEAAASKIREVEAQKALKRERDFSQSITQTANSLIVCLDHDAKITVFNQECERVTGYKREEVLGKRWPELFLPPDHRHHELTSFAKWVRVHPQDQYEGPLITKSGEIRTILWSNTAIFGSKEEEMIAIAIGQDITERKKTEDALRESEEKWRSLAMNAPNIIMIVDRKGIIQFINRTVSPLTIEETIGKKMYDYIEPEYHSLVKKTNQRVFQTGKSGTYQIRGVGPDGKIAWYETQVGPILRDGWVVAATSIITDITKRKKAEQSLQHSEERFRSLIENSTDVIAILDKDLTILYESPTFEKILGYKPEKVIGMRGADFVHPEDITKVIKAFSELVKKPNAVDSMEFRAQHKNGSWRTLEAVGKNLLDNPTVKGVVLNYRDITERKQAEEELRIKDSAITSSINAIALADLQGNLTYVNSYFLKLWGYDEQHQVLRKPATIFWHSKEKAKGVITVLQDRGNWIGEMVAKRKDGSLFDAQVSTSIVKDRTGKPLCLMASFLDVTDRNKADDALHQSEERYRSLFEHSPISLWEEDFSEVKRYIDNLKDSGIKDFKGYFENNPKEISNCASKVKVLDVNKASLKLFKAKNKQELQRGLYKTFRQESYDAFREELVAIAEGKTMFETEATTQTLTSDEKNVIIRWLVAPGYEKTLSKVLVSIGDITERKKAEKAIRENEEQLRLLTNSLPVLISYVDSGQRYRFNNKSYEDWFGHSRFEFLGKHIKSVLGNSAYQSIKRYVEKALSGEEVTFETDITNKDAGIRYVRVTYVPDFGEHGKVKGFYTLVTDITEHKKADDALKESEEKIKNIFSSISDAVTVTDLKGKVIECNQATLDLHGFSSRDQVMGINSFEFIAPKDRALAKNNLKKTLKQGFIKDAEYTLLTKDKHEFPGELSASLVRDALGKPTAFVAITKDITERKKAEEALRKSRDLNTILQISYQITKILDMDKMLKLTCREIVKALGIDRCTIGLIDEEKKEGVVKAIYLRNQPPSSTTDIGFLLSDFPKLIQIYKRKVKFIHVPSIEKALLSRKEKDYFKKLEMKSFVIVPIDTGKRLLGALLVATTEKERCFTEAEITFVQTLANHLAIAVENVRLMEVVKGQTENLQILSKQVINAQEEERKRIAGELHDEIGQNLAAIKWNMDLNKKELPPEFTQISDRITDNEKYLNETLQQVRNMISDLRPTTLDDLGLISTLDSYINSFTKRTNIKVTFKTDHLRDRLSSDIEMVLYQIAKEALTNVAKHAKATIVSIRLERKNNFAILDVKDNGVGFDIKNMTNKRKLRKGFGLFNIKERVSLLNGSFIITSKPKKGTNIQVRIPCSGGA